MLDRLSPDCAPPSGAGSSEFAMANVVDEIAVKLQRGEQVDVEEIVGQYPQWGEPLRRLVPALEALAVVGQKEGSGFSVQGSGEGKKERRRDGEQEDVESGTTPPTPALPRREREETPKAQDQRPKTSSLNPKSKIQNPKLDDFELVREVGRGGMGIVYEARQLSLARRVAVKVLPAACLLDPRQLQRFQNEARAAAQLNHPHIVDVICVGCDEGVHYFAMRFVEGRTLAEVIGRRSQESGVRSQNDGQDDADGPMLARLAIQNPKSKIQNCAEWLAQAAEALDHAHGLGIVHRDIKPSNLLIDNDDKLWVTDFGLARFGDDAALTMTGDLLGTLRYMSPEQAIGQRAVIDHRSDIYSLGATLYELLAGVPVFEGVDRSDLLRQLVFSQPRPLRKVDPSIPRDLETITLKALEKSPGDRYSTAGEMAADLRRFIRGEPILAKPPTLMQRTVKWCLRHGHLVAAAALLLVLAVAGLSVSTVLIVRSSNAARVAQKAAEDRDRESRRMLSAVETRLALQAYQRGELERAKELLDRQVPGSRIRDNSGTDDGPTSQEAGYGTKGAEDLRDFTWHWLRGVVDAKCPELRSFDNYPSEVYEIDFSPDGKLLAAACHHKIVVRDLQSGNIVYEIAAHKSSVTSLDFSPDGTLLASVGDDHHVRLWNVATGELAADLGEHDCQATAVGFSPDGSRLASGDDRGTVRIWDVAGRRQERMLKEHTGKIDGAVFADRSTLIIDSGDYVMSGWDVDSGHARWKVVAPHTPLMSMAVSPDGATVVAGDHVGRAGLWNVTDGRALVTLGTRPTLIQTVAFSPDSKLVAAGGHDGVAQLWNVAAHTYCGQTAKHRERVWSVAFSPDGQTLGTGSRDRSVKLWDINARRQPRRFSVGQEAPRLAFSPHGKLAIFGDRKFWLWEGGNSTPIAFGSLTGNAGPALVWLAGKPLSTNVYGDLTRIDVDTGATSLWARRRPRPCALDMSVSPDGAWLSLRDAVGDCELWEVATRKVRCRYVGLPAVFTSDGKTAIYSKERRLLRLRLNQLEAVEQEVVPGRDQASVLALSRDDRLLALGSEDSTIEILELATGQRRTLRGHERAVWALDFSPDCRTLASGGADGTVRFWRVDVGELLGIFERRTNGNFRQVVFSPDGRRLAAASDDGIGGAVSLWEIEPPDESEPQH